MDREELKKRWEIAKERENPSSAIGASQQPFSEPKRPVRLRGTLWITTLLLFAVLAIGFSGWFVYRHFEERSEAQERDRQARAAAEKAIAELTKLRTATEVGINRQSYASLLIQAKATIDTSLIFISDENLKDSVLRTAGAYDDAMRLWNLAGTDADWLITCHGDPTLPFKSSMSRIIADVQCNTDAALAKELAQKYQIPIRVLNSPDILEVRPGEAYPVLGQLHKRDGYDRIWLFAAESLAEARAIISSPRE